MHYGGAPTTGGPPMPHDAPLDEPQPERRTFDDALGRRIVDLHIRAVQEGLRGAAAYDLFDGFCQRLVAAGVPLWRGLVGTAPLPPQRPGSRHFCRRGLNTIPPPQFRPRRFPARPGRVLSTP